MCGTKETQTTVDSAQDALLNQLFDNACRLLPDPPSRPAKVTYDDLQPLLQRIGSNKFMETYSYAYKGDQTKPVPPPKDGIIHTTEDTVMFSSVDDRVIAQYVNSRLLASMDLGNLKDAASSELVSLGIDLFEERTDNDWMVQNFTRDLQYHDTNSLYTLRGNSTFVYTNASWVTAGEECKYVIIQYTGVYFNVDCTAMVARKYVLDTLLDNAKLLSPIARDPGDGGQLQRMQVILEPYLRAKFREHFNYEYNGDITQPLKMTHKESSYRLHATISLCMPQSNDAAVVASFVRANILSSMDLPAYLRNPTGEVHSDLVSYIQDLLGNGTANAWLADAYTKDYASPNVAVSSVSTDSMFVYVNAKAPPEAGTEFDQIFIYYIGVFYPYVPPVYDEHIVVLQRLLAEAKKLGDDLPNPDSADPLHAIGAVVSAFANGEFYNDFGYRFDTSNARPDDLAPSKKARGISILLEYNTRSVDSATLRRDVKLKIVDELGLQAWVEDQVLNSLMDHLISSLDESTIGWDSNEFSNDFAPSKLPDLLYDCNVRGILTIANDLENENCPVHLIHFLGLAYLASDGKHL